ncbi:c-type cytochrome [Polyangium jinanense]|uniref:Cytochrome c n=1 Tax=Polyangium jinanense TaxID=2829994 RepID=A0A9X3WVG2_9BACT|nr:cytochrome c [Polyangium jinanense]MDC3953929.1 cytochrome c [Polyangium jinanense]MDC3957858.1 cytochrome c [Polyangium jinanense]MDC3978944.1 cytochrome c [Polyangium jinanense]MDC3982115.1 cytochrome c [Polyangium jinanense]
MKTIAALPLVLAVCPLLASCNSSGTERDFERMVNQAHFEYYEEAPFFDDRRVMREPPEGTVPRERFLGPPEVISGMVDGKFVEAIPIPLSRPMLDHGRERYEVFCAACHGVGGDGVSVVADNMELRKPPSFVEAPVLDYPVGRVYQAIAQGYGLMPTYGQELGVEERWSVVAYVRALQLRTKGVAVGVLPEPVRVRMQEELR